MQEKEYQEIFNSINKADPDYIDKLIYTINKLLLERTNFVKSNGDERKRIEFFKLVREKLEELLEENDQVEYLSSGHSSLAFKINDKVLKIGKSKIDTKKYRKEFSCTIPMFLDECMEIGDKEFYTLQITPYVDTRDISNEDLYAAYEKLRKEGYIWNDPTKDNVGRIQSDIDYNGTHYSKGDVVILDLEDIAYVGEITSDDVLDEISCMSYNRNVYRFETKYMDEYHKNKTI